MSNYMNNKRELGWYDPVTYEVSEETFNKVQEELYKRFNTEDKDGSCTEEERTRG